MSDPIDILKHYNAWRRGGEGDMPAPAEIGLAIDAAIGEILRLREVEAAARNLVAVKGRHHSAIAYQRLAEVLKP